MKKIWAVYSQFEPTWKYEETIESIWSTYGAALDAAENLPKSSGDIVWVAPIMLDSESIHPTDEHYDEGDLTVVRKLG